MVASAPKTIEFGKAATIVTGNAKQLKITYKILDNFGSDVTSKYYASANVTVSGYTTIDKTKAGIVIVTGTTDFVANQLNPVVITIIATSGTDVASGSKQYTVSAASFLSAIV